MSPAAGSRRGARALSWAAAAALVALPLLSGKFATYLGVRVALLAIFGTGYNLLLGRTGLLSFGHGGFYAAGAYALGLCSLHLTAHPLPGLALALAAGAAAALVVGFFCIRASEVYFSMLTLAFGMLIFAVVWNAREITGGDDGLVGVMRAPIALGPLRLDIAGERAFYLLAVALLAGSLWLAHRLRRSPFGLTLAGIRENPVRAEFAGVPVRRYRLAAFVISGAYAGLAGGLEVLLESNARPTMAHWTHSAEPILVSLLGGLHSLLGPAVGSLAFVALREVVQRFTENWMLAFGVVLLVIILGFRGGIVGAVEAGLRARRAGRAAP
ncbi:MAG: branched-chain amino acid ABC transporter permease [Deltaproteobacteria bacterium]|nr:branched-chain amino acid ABC transporter permease [Deltaproteobacteria bacterium]